MQNPLVLSKPARVGDRVKLDFTLHSGRKDVKLLLHFCDGVPRTDAEMSEFSLRFFRRYDEEPDSNLISLIQASGTQVHVPYGAVLKCMSRIKLRMNDGMYTAACWARSDDVFPEKVTFVRTFKGSGLLHQIPNAPPNLYTLPHTSGRYYTDLTHGAEFLIQELPSTWAKAAV